MWNTSVHFLLFLIIETCVHCKWCKENQRYPCCSNYFLNITTNQCQVCPDGYFGVNCSMTCYPGLYGKICQQVCPPECKDTCHYVTGDCPGTSTLTDAGSSSGYISSSVGLLDEDISQHQQRRTIPVDVSDSSISDSGVCCLQFQVKVDCPQQKSGIFENRRLCNLYSHRKHIRNDQMNK